MTYFAASKGVVTSFVISNLLGQRFGQFDCAVLIAFFTAAQQDDDHLPPHRVIEPITRAIIDPNLTHALAKRFSATKQTGFDPRDANAYLFPRPNVAKTIKPIDKLFGALDAIYCRLYTTEWSEDQGTTEFGG